MKNILVPTDFSACAGFAVDAATKLAKKFDSVLHIMHALPNTSQEQKPEETQQANENAQTLLQRLADQAGDLDVVLTVTTGKLKEAMKTYLQDHQVDMVVMGSHGAGGKQEFFIGSNTQKVIRTVHCPVLVIKEKLEDIDFNKVVFASNFNINEKDAFLRFKDFVKHFIPEIHLVMVHTSSLFDPPYTLSQSVMNDFKELCHPFATHTHIYRDFTIERGIRGFAEDIGAKLIGISNSNRSPLKRMLIGSNVEALVNHSRLPVLSIDYKQKNNQHEEDTIPN
jgi:nucleotide-binding universal stress UspA family protein